ncbi:hypothetical protein D3C76_950780 [compost metagenome]
MLRRRLAPLGQVLVENPGRLLRIGFQLVVQPPVLRVGRERGLDLHVGEDIAGAQCLFQRIERGLGFLRVDLLINAGLSIPHLLRLGRVGRLDVFQRQCHGRLQRAHALLNAGIERGLIVNPGVFVGLDHVAGTDFLHPVLEVVGRLVRTAGRLHLHLQHRAQGRDRIHAGAAVFLHRREQLREPLGHVTGLKAARLALEGDRLQGLLHDTRVVDLGVLLQRHDHAGRVDARRPLADGELGRRRRVGHGLVQLHAGADQLVDQIRHVIARHARVLGRVDHRPG